MKVYFFLVCYSLCGFMYQSMKKGLGEEVIWVGSFCEREVICSEKHERERERVRNWCPLLMITLYHQIKTPISF